MIMFCPMIRRDKMSPENQIAELRYLQQHMGTESPTMFFSQRRKAFAVVVIGELKKIAYERQPLGSWR